MPGPRPILADWCTVSIEGVSRQHGGTSLVMTTGTGARDRPARRPPRPLGRGLIVEARLRLVSSATARSTNAFSRTPRSASAAPAYRGDKLIRVRPAPDAPTRGPARSSPSRLHVLTRTLGGLGTDLQGRCPMPRRPDASLYAAGGSAASAAAG